MVKCHRCNATRLWKLRSGKFRCAVCKTSFRPSIGGIHLSKSVLKNVIAEFDLEHSTNVILERCVISKYTLLKLLTALRTEMTKDIPKEFSGVVEGDETYLGGKWRNKRLKTRKFAGKQKRGRGTLKQPVFGILCRDGKVFAELVQDVEAIDLQPIIEQKVRKGSTVYSDVWRAYTGIATKGYVHRLVDHGKEQYSDRRGGHINGLEGFSRIPETETRGTGWNSQETAAIIFR